MTYQGITPRKRPIIILDHVMIQLQAQDLDGDGKTGGVERVTAQRLHNMQAIISPTELGEATKEINKDEMESSGRPSIDLRTRLHPEQIAWHAAWDWFWLPEDTMQRKAASLTWIVERKLISLEGKSRAEHVAMVQGKQQMDINKSGGIRQFLGMNNPPRE